MKGTVYGCKHEISIVGAKGFQINVFTKETFTMQSFFICVSALENLVADDRFTYLLWFLYTVSPNLYINRNHDKYFK